MTPKRKINKRKISMRSNKSARSSTYTVISKVETIPLPLETARTFINKILKLGGKTVVTKESKNKVSVVATMKSVPLSSKQANALAAQSKASGATVRIVEN